MAAWNITCKDLRLLLGDKRALVLLILLPLMFNTIIGMATGQLLTKDEDQRKLKLAIFDESRSEYSQSLIKTLEAHDGIRILEKNSLADARQAADKGEASVILTIPKDYEQRVDEVRISDILDSANSSVINGPDALGLVFEMRTVIGDGGVIKWLIYSDALRTIAPVAARKNNLARRLLKSREETEDETETAPVESSVSEAAAPPAQTPHSPFQPEDTEVEHGEKRVYLTLVPSFTVMFVFFLINIMARSFIEEHDHGTLRRLQLAPISSAAILVGKTLPFYLTSVIQTSMLFLCGRLLFGMSWGMEPVYLIPVILCTSLAATTLGLLLATLVKTDQQVSAYGTSLVLVLGGISGCMFPRVWLPAGMKKISLATPHAWALEAFDAILTRSHVDSLLVMDCCAILLAFSAAFFFFGWWRFRTIQ